MNTKKWPAIVFPLLGLGVFGLLLLSEQGVKPGPGDKTTTTKLVATAATPAAGATTSPTTTPPPPPPAPTPPAPTPEETAKAGPQATEATPALPSPPRPTTANPVDEAAAAKGEVAVFFSANNMGELVDCGCHRSPLGGLARRVSWINERATRYAAAAHVDCGGSLVADAAVSSDGPGQAASRIAVYLAGLARAKTVALNVAPAELAVDVAMLRREAKRHGIPLVATNTVSVGDGSPAFQPWIIKKIGALNVGFLGLSTQRPPRRQVLYTAQGLALTPPVEAAQAAVKSLRGKVDAIVAMTWLTRDEIDLLGEKVPEIDFVLGAKDTDLTMRAEFLGRGYRLDSYNKGKWLGELRLRAGRGAEGRWFDPALRDRLAYDQGSAQRQIAYYVKKHTGEDKAGGPADARGRTFEVERLVGLRAKLARVNLELRGTIDPPDGAASFSAKMHPMRTSLPEDADVVARVKSHHATFPPPPRP